MGAMTERALIVTRHGGPEVLEVQERAPREPAPGEIAVTVDAVGVNFIDVYYREGRYPAPTPFVLASEAAGTVSALGHGVDGTGVDAEDGARIRVGDRVAWAMVDGSAATTAVVRADKVVPVPEAVSSEHAAAAMLQGMTAHYLSHDTYPIKGGDWALVHAAAGGVGQLLTQLIVARGGRVVATAGTDDKCAIARSRGAEVAINYSQVEDLAAAVREATGGDGVDVAYDGVGAATFDASLASLRPRGMLVLYGAASGPVPPFDLQRLNSGGSLFVTRPSLAHYIATWEELQRRGTEVLGAVADGSLQLAIGGRWALEDAPDAYRALESRSTTGKLLLIP